MSQSASSIKAVSPPAHAKAKSSMTLRSVANPRILVPIGAAVAVVVTVVLLIYWKTRPLETPRLDAPIAKILDYVNDERFKLEPFERRIVYLDLLDKRKEELKSLHASRRITDREYHTGLTYAWFGKHLARMEKFASMKDMEQEQYLRNLAIGEYWQEHYKKNPSSAPVGWQPKSEEDKRDKTIDKIYPLTWPQENQLRWKEFHKAYSKAFKAVKANPPKEPPKKDRKPGEGNGK